MDRNKFVNMLKAKGHKRVYISHEEDAESENDARAFALFLENNGITALVGADYREIGESAVREAIKSSDAVIPHNIMPKLGAG